jgi:23S rRNA (adenine2503-C2)-methyltransferase
MKINLLNLTIHELENLMFPLDEKKFRANQLFDWFYKKGVLDLEQMSNFSEEFKNKLLRNFIIQIPQIHEVAHSDQDNSYKFLLKTHDEKLIESILMPIENRLTLCVSCMIGCPLKCKFCATGSELKFIRKLEVSEIIGQVLATQNYIQEHNLLEKQKITNIVFMGMGEPLLNKENISKSIEILLDKNSFGISRNKITLSTAGVIDGLSDLINKYRIKLAVSLHFPTDEQRNQFMPINQKYPLSKLISELKKIDPSKKDYITIEYLMLDGINDTLEHAKQLIKLLNSLKVKINLIPYNPTKTFNAQPSSEKQIDLFAKYINSKDIMVTVRRSRGKKIQGACGQFALKRS